MPVVDVVEEATFAETMAVGWNTELCKVAERRNTLIVHLETGSILYKISVSLTSDLHNYLVAFEMYDQHLIPHQPAC